MNLTASATSRHIVSFMDLTVWTLLYLDKLVKLPLLSSETGRLSAFSHLNHYKHTTAKRKVLRQLTKAYHMTATLNYRNRKKSKKPKINEEMNKDSNGNLFRVLSLHAGE